MAQNGCENRQWPITVFLTDEIVLITPTWSKWNDFLPTSIMLVKTLVSTKSHKNNVCEEGVGFVYTTHGQWNECLRKLQLRLSRPGTNRMKDLALELDGRKRAAWGPP